LSTAGKIRLLLALLFASLLFTASIVQSNYTPVNNLDQTAQILENNLHKKEAYISKVLYDKAQYNSLKTLQNNPQLALKYIGDFVTYRSTWFVTFTNDTLSFWSGVKVIPQKNSDIKEGVSFIQEPNGYYEAIKKSEGNFSAIFFIPVKINYLFQNQYLQNKFAADLLRDDNIEIADFTDANIYSVHSSLGNNHYLFSVKLKKDKVNWRFFYFELVAWLLTFITLCILMHNICQYFVGRGYVALSLLTLGLFIIAVRYFNLHYHWPGFIYQLGVFSPGIFSDGSIYPTLGDVCINTLFITWFAAFLFTQRNKLLKAIPGKLVSYTILIICIAVLLVGTTALLQLFYGLVSDSKISFDVYNVFGLSKLSLEGLLVLCFTFLIFFLLSDTFIAVCNKLPVPDPQKIIIFSIAIIITVVVAPWSHTINWSYLLLAIPVFLRGYAYRFRQGKIDSTPFIAIIFVFALIAFTRYYRIHKRNNYPRSAHT
jgi:two-component system nitrogen regulation sensor histidine kinase NtrY